MRVFALAVVVCLSVVFVSVGARPAALTLTGVVVDELGQPLPGVTVTLMAPGQPRRTTVTNAKGEFTFAVPAGRYAVTATLEGFGRFTKDIVVSAAATTVTIALPVAAAAEAVVVSPEVPSPPRSVSGGVVGGVVGGVAGGSAGGSVTGVHARRAYAPPPSFNTEAYRSHRRQCVSPRHERSAVHVLDRRRYRVLRERPALPDGRRAPAEDAVRTEELINYFRFAYAEPSADAPFSVTTEVADCPWNPTHRLALVGLRAREIESRAVPPRNLVFLLDVSGSMQPPDKLPLVQTAMRMLVDTLTANDRVAIVVYAGASGLALPSTHGDRKDRIHQAIADLQAGGSTNGAEGITLAYQMAQRQFIKGGINRVILATDGDFNVGVTSQGELIRLIEEKRASGIFLSVLGVGRDNLKDSTMEKLADKGNGNYAYLDSLHEARKVLVAEGGATLITVAKDVKIQVEFNPAAVGAYRLIGYENRVLRNEDFNDDKKDAGEIGAGHTVTALYEIVPAGVKIPASTVDPLKYQQPPTPVAGANAGELMTVKLRYKQPTGDDSRLISVPVKNQTATLSPNLGFAAAVAEFGMLLRKSEHRGGSTWEQAASLARRFRGDDPEGYRAEFIRIVELAAALEGQGGKKDGRR